MIKDNLMLKIEKISKKKFFLEYNLSEIVFTKKKNISLKMNLKKNKRKYRNKWF